MNFTILLVHYKTWKMTAYSISKLIQHAGKHDIEILVCDNSPDDGSMSEVAKVIKDSRVKVVQYPTDKLQSHGIGFDHLMPYVNTEWFITVESDSFPTQDNWLDYYQDLIEKGFDCAGSLLKLSGGEYIHPAGAMYKTSDWVTAKEVVMRTTPHINYYPNLGVKDNFPCHIMTNEILTDFPNKHHSYNNVSFAEQLERYLPVAHSVFHNGIGGLQESLLTYHRRNIASGVIDMTTPTKFPIYRIGYEPGQWFCYHLAAENKSIFPIPTETVWLPNRVNQQQEYTIMENGFTHLWGVSAYHGATGEDLQDIIQFKQNQMESLYNELPSM